MCVCVYIYILIYILIYIYMHPHFIHVDFVCLRMYGFMVVCGMYVRVVTAYLCCFVTWPKAVSMELNLMAISSKRQILGP